MKYLFQCTHLWTREVAYVSYRLPNLDFSVGRVRVCDACLCDINNSATDMRGVARTLSQAILIREAKEDEIA